ncbi:MAG: hypothetical protein ACPH2K_01360 [Flavicella sp.]
MKRKILLGVCTFLCSFIVFSKTEKPTLKQNELTKYLSENVPKKLLAMTIYKKGVYFINASFSLDKNNEVYNFKTTNKNKKLNEAIQTAFEKYPVDKLPIKNIGQGYSYSFEIIQKNGRQNIFACSDVFNSKTAVSYEQCNAYKQYPDIYKCFKETVKEQIMCNLNFDLIDLSKEFLYISFKVENDGRLIFTSKSQSKTYKNEMRRVFKLLKKARQAFQNKSSIVTHHQICISLKPKGLSNTTCPIDVFDPLSFINQENVTETLQESIFEELGNPSNTNDLALFFKENVSDELLSRNNLNSLNKNLLLFFSIDKNDKLQDLKTNARSKILSNELIKVFSKYPLEKLNLRDNNTLNKYSLQVLSFEEGKTILNVSSEIMYSRLPILNACKKIKDPNKMRACFSNTISKNLKKNFSSRMEAGLKPGPKSIDCRFVYEADGRIGRIKVKAPNENLKNETIRVIQRLPKAKYGAIHNGKPVSVRYALPIKFVVH